MKKYLKKEIKFAGKTLSFEINKVAPQTNSSVIARCGDTAVLVTVSMGAEKPIYDGTPLTVDFVERLYAGGIIKGSRWVKREGRPTDEATLTSRLIDRSIRPLFPKDLINEVQIIVTLLSTDGENDHDTLALNAVSVALAVSNVPWAGPIGAVRMGQITKEDKGLIVDPLTSEMEFSDLDLVVSSSIDGVLMIESGAKQLPEDKMQTAIVEAFSYGSQIAKEISEIAKEMSVEKYPYISKSLNKDLMAKIEKDYKANLQSLLDIDSPESKMSGSKIEEFKKKVTEDCADDANKSQIPQIVEYIFKKMLRAQTLDKKKRIDGRGYEDVRQISAEVGILARTHGSGLFTRGLTQVLSVVTLASPSLEQWIETAEGMEEKRYIHHYNAPPYSTGEVGRMGGLGRREIGHGALAERALYPVIPTNNTFPYTIRVVSEVLSQNGSSSMGSTCGSTLALMDAGVPITAPVAGVAMGLVAENSDNYAILTDLRGEEDFYGNMDFKIAGSETGITAIQLDIKLNEGFKGLTVEMIEKVLAQARVGRLMILEKMLAVLPQSRKTVSQYAPKVVSIKIPVEKIGEIIGPGGKVIKNIIATTGADVDVEDDGTVSISATDEQAVEKAKKWVENLTRELVIGDEFEGEVKRILPFGAFVELVPGKEGLVHVSKMSNDFVSNPEDVVKIGQRVKVKVYEIDEMGRVNLVMDGVDPNKQSSIPPQQNFQFRPRPPMVGGAGGAGGGFRRRPSFGPSTSAPQPYRGGRRDR